MINGRDYYVQEMYSNLDGASGPNRGCAQNEAQTAQDAGTATAAAAGTLRLSQLEATLKRLPAKVTVTPVHAGLAAGKSTPVTVQVLAPSGAPVANDHVVIDVTSSTEGHITSCGKLSSYSGMTNTAGKLTVSYTASSASAACTLIAIEGTTGQHGAVTIYIGKLTAICPLTAYKAPPAISEGKLVNFSAAINNPADPISDTMTAVNINGDDTLTHGVSAGQLKLQWRSGSSAKWTTVSLTGDTKGKGMVTGFLQRAPKTFPGRTIEHLQLRLTLTGKASYGTQLSLSLAVDQVNGASGSCNNMYAAATSFAVRR